jgi:hypothetical protein
MKLTRLLVPLLSGLVLAMALVLGVAWAGAPAGGAVRYVSPAGADSGACDTSAAPCATVQYAVDVAAEGDEVRVAAGTYTGVLTRSAPSGYPGPTVITQTLHLTKSVTVQGGYSADFSAQDPDLYTTTLDAQGLGRLLFIAEDIAPTVRDLHLVNGDAGGLGGHPVVSNTAGGGIYVVTATAMLDNLHVVSNTAPGFSYGGGVFLYHSPSTLSQNTLQGNFAGYQGGGVDLFESDALVMDNLILENEANVGGGLHAYQSSFILSRNLVQENEGFSGGAGISIDNSNYPNYLPLLSGNLVLSNTAMSGFGYGGGLYLFFSDPAMSGNLFQGNTSDFGGGAYVYLSEPTSTNDVFLGNQASQTAPGVYLNGSQLLFTHATLSGNSGGDGSGLYLLENSDFGSTIYSTAVLTNAIVVEHSLGITTSIGNTATVNGVLWFNNSGGDTAGAGTALVSNAFTGDPAFAADGYHLTANSLALDRGVDSGVADDLDGDPRPQGAAHDLGADEYQQFSLYLALIQR